MTRIETVEVMHIHYKYETFTNTGTVIAVDKFRNYVYLELGIAGLLTSGLTIGIASFGLLTGDCQSLICCTSGLKYVVPPRTF